MPTWVISVFVPDLFSVDVRQLAVQEGRRMALQETCGIVFFQAEDGIRDLTVTGVQTCALPISERNYDDALKEFSIAAQTIPNDPEILDEIGSIYRRQGRWREALANFRRAQELDPRSEERRVGKECRSRWSPYH